MSTIPPPPPPSSPAPATPPPPPPNAPAAPAKASSGNKVLIIILCVLGGLFLLVGGCVATCTYFVAKKGKEFSAQAQKNPAYVALSFGASVHPDVEVVSKDADSGKITLRNKQSGKVITIDTTQYNADNVAQALEQFARNAQVTAEKISAAAEQEVQKAETMAQEQTQTAAAGEENADDDAEKKATLEKVPDYLRDYPGAKDEDASFETPAGLTLANYSATSADKPEAILNYYEKKLTRAGYSIAMKTGTDTEALINATAANPARTVVVLVGPSEDAERHQVNVTYQQVGK